MVLRLLGIKPVDDARLTARRESRATKESATQLASAVADLTAIEAELKGAKETAAEAKDVAKASATELKQATATEQAAAKAFAEIDAARQRVEKLTIQLLAKTEEHGRLAEQRAALAERAGTLEEALLELPALQAELAGLADVEGRLRAAVQLADATAALVEAEAALEAVPDVDTAAVLAELQVATRVHADAQLAAASAEAERGQPGSARGGGAAAPCARRRKPIPPSRARPAAGRSATDFAEYVRHARRASTAARKTGAAEAVKAAKAASAARAAAPRRRRGPPPRHADRRAATRRQTEADVVSRSQLEQHLGGGRDARRAVRRPRPPTSRRSEPGPGRLRRSAGGSRSSVPSAEHLEHTRRDLARRSNDRVTALEGELAALTKEAEALSFDRRRSTPVSGTSSRRPGRPHRGRPRQTNGRRATPRRTPRAAWRSSTGELRQAKETAARVDELRSEARYVERVGDAPGRVPRPPRRPGRARALARGRGPVPRAHEPRVRRPARWTRRRWRSRSPTGTQYFALDRFSGSESDLANLALRVAISTHLSRVSGTDVGMLVLDEVLGSLDEERKDLMVQTLGRLASRFHQLFVITHAERVKDQFPASILVQKTGRRRSTATLV